MSLSSSSNQFIEVRAKINEIIDYINAQQEKKFEEYYDNFKKEPPSI